MREAIKAAGKIIGLSLGCIALVLIAAGINFLIPAALVWAQISDQDLEPDEVYGMLVGGGGLTIALTIANVLWWAR